VIHLDLADVLVIADRVLGPQPDPVVETADLDGVEAVLEQARRRDDLPQAAATLLHGLVLRQPFGRRSGEVALVAALQLMALNDHEVVELGSPDRARTLLGLAASGQVSVDELCDWLAEGTGRARLLEVEVRERLQERPLAEAIRRVRELRPGRRKDKGSEEAMFERFTDRARRVVVSAQEEARDLGHNYIGTEHVLLGLTKEGHGLAAKALESLGVSLEAVRAQVVEIIGLGKDTPKGHIPFTPRAKKVLELALREALALHHNYIGTEHILLGLVREGEGVAAQVLVKLGAELPRVREQVVQLLATGQYIEVATEAEAKRREQEITASVTGVFQENRRLRAEVERLKELLRQHGIESDGGESKTA
jgi:hypothetical protein